MTYFILPKLFELPLSITPGQFTCLAKPVTVPHRPIQQPVIAAFQQL